ncbi:aminoglycoside phosphotransferase family protein [Brevibacillus humidisoli]|uniref:aminoglycoside phosphotransferase family protein n=1 Tax=Brevibacillus humidisoli TaxID=2895522 RepID=UPI001E5EE491|nr:aminoglycoside phosphotransferase family protein [Brevibacillus humidisoli]UFJ39068.1 aminoglycoside phosphotransferase family protein [Brevibacillus humidisoli]
MSRFEDIYPLFGEYDMFAQTVDVVKEPNVYKAITPYGSFVCKRTTAPQGRLHFMGGVLRHLQQRGWDGAIPFVYTKYDEPFVKRGEHTYYLTPWQLSVPFDRMQLSTWGEATLVRLAELHHLTQNYRFDDPRQVEPLVNSLLTRWQDWTDKTKRWAKEAESSQYPSPFDIVLLANQAFLLDLAENAVRLLREWRERHRTHAHFRLSIIHGHPQPAHTLVDRSGQVRLINFDRSAFDTPARDVTMFYRTYFQMGGTEASASELFNKYTTVFPLRPEEVSLVSIFLLYPERVMRDIEMYYERKQDWNELFAVRRMEKDIDRLMHLSRWVQQAF